MKQKINGINAAAFKFLFCAVLIILFSGTAFAHVPELILNPLCDLRIEMVYSYDAIIGYNLFVRQKPGIESVILTEPTGYYALRSLEWNCTNGYEIRQISGRTLTDLYSRNSIISSTPVPDCEFGRAFILFIPTIVVYGNPSSYGPVSQNILNGIQLNIRTFDHKFGDPNRGRYQNNVVMISPPGGYGHGVKYNEFASAYPSYGEQRPWR